MSDLRETIKSIQRHVGVTPDGVLGPVTADAVLCELRNARLPLQAEKTGPARSIAGVALDARSEKYLAQLDPKAQPFFREFLCLAKATAATLGCDYVAIGGNRTWEEQQALYDQGRTQPGKKVTNARPGYSWHNYGVALDFGVFRSGEYQDSENPALASKVHRACSMHAAACGLIWGGAWKSPVDEPHYQIASLPASPTAEHRATFTQKGSVL